MEQTVKLEVSIADAELLADIATEGYLAVHGDPEKSAVLSYLKLETAKAKRLDQRDFIAGVGEAIASLNTEPDGFREAYGEVTGIALYLEHKGIDPDSAMGRLETVMWNDPDYVPGFTGDALRETSAYGDEDSVTEVVRQFDPTDQDPT